MTADAPISELELVVLACATSPLSQEALQARVADVWVSPAPLPTASAWFSAVMNDREAGLLDSLDLRTYQTSPRGHRLLQRALCGALGAPRATASPDALSFPQALALAELLPVPTLVTVLRTRLEALDRQQRALSTALEEAHGSGASDLRVAALNLREGRLNAERAFLFTFLDDVEKGLVSLCRTFSAAPPVTGVAVARA